ncbi:MAG: type II secretion system protein [Vibrionaceae bacterium]
MLIKSNGFSLLEAVAVIAIACLLAIFVAPTFRQADFSAFVHRNSALSIAEFIQLRAMQQGDSTLPENQILLNNNYFGSVAAFDARGDARNNERLQASPTMTILSNNMPSKIYFDALGRPTDADANLLCTNVCQINFVANGVIASLCVNEEGYFHACGS